MTRRGSRIVLCPIELSRAGLSGVEEQLNAIFFCLGLETESMDFGDEGFIPVANNLDTAVFFKTLNLKRGPRSC